MNNPFDGLAQRTFSHVLDIMGEEAVWLSSKGDKITGRVLFRNPTDSMIMGEAGGSYKVNTQTAEFYMDTPRFKSAGGPGKPHIVGGYFSQHGSRMDSRPRYKNHLALARKADFFPALVQCVRGKDMRFGKAARAACRRKIQKPVAQGEVCQKPHTKAFAGGAVFSGLRGSRFNARVTGIFARQCLGGRALALKKTCTGFSGKDKPAFFPKYFFFGIAFAVQNGAVLSGHRRYPCGRFHAALYF